MTYIDYGVDRSLQSPFRFFFHDASQMRAAKQIYQPSRAMKTGLRLLSGLRHGHLTLTLPNGQVRTFKGRTDGPQAALHIHNDRVVSRFLKGGKLGFCEAYLDGDWSSPDMTAFFELILQNSAAMKNELLGKPWMRWISKMAHVLQPNSRKGAQKNIYSHYDIGNDFYGSWLDDTMTYSAGIFKETTGDSAANKADNAQILLKIAQEQKYQRIIDRLNITADMHVLEIGCGWGGFLEYAAKTTGCKITAVTISKAQYDFATKRIRDASLDSRVEILLRDYRDLDGQYDAIVSIEMFEAVGEAYWPVYFSKVKALLKENAEAVLQIITIDENDFDTYRRSADYIQRYIFPGGMLPSLPALTSQTSQAGLSEIQSFSFGPDYGRTLKIWNDRFQSVWPSLRMQQGKFDDRFKRLWEQYLCYCEAGFNVGTIDVIHYHVKNA